MTQHFKDPNLALRNLARGGAKYRLVREQVFRIIRANTHEPLKALTPFLYQRLLGLDENWVNLSFGSIDRKNLNDLKTNDNPVTETNLLRLATMYIATNAKRVNNLLGIRRRIDCNLFCSDVEQLSTSINSIDLIDRQSLFYLRSSAAIHFAEPKEIIEGFKKQTLSEFVRKALLYPLVYYFANLPRDEGIDLHLSYILPGLEEHETDQRVVRFLINDTILNDEALSFKAYLALSLHPFDARDILINHFDQRIAKTGQLSSEEFASLEIIHRTCPDIRSSYHLQLAEQKIHFSEKAESLAIAQYLELPHRVSELLISITSIEDLAFVKPTQIIEYLLWASRKEKYPKVADYDNITGASIRYWFTDFGRFISCFLTSLYLLPRRTEAHERRELLGMQCYIGHGSPFIYASPGGYQLLRNLQLVDHRGQPVFRNDITRVIDRKASSSDRLWLKRVHWQLDALQELMRIKDWLALARKQIPLAPDYLTGISWIWLDTVIAKFRIRPFMNDPNGIYILLLRQVELRKSESNELRAAIEPLTRKLQFDDFIKKLFNEYSELAVGFLRYFLNPNLILYLQFTDNYIEALSHRMHALEMFYEKFGETSLLTEEQLAQEASAFTTELLLSNVEANQFEINWEALKRDISSQHEDLYKAFAAFRDPENKTTALLSEAKRSFPHQFSNGRTVAFETTVRRIPLLTLICSVIDSFMGHPTQGIEGILSIRIRHHNLRRHFASALDGLRQGRDSTINAYDRTILVHFEDAIYSTIQHWVDLYMHQDRPDNATGVFRFTPSSEEMSQLCNELENAEFVAILERTTGWLRGRLLEDLQVAREKLVYELRPSLEAEIRKIAHERITLREDPQQSVQRVEAALITTVNHLVDELRGWFQSTEYSPHAPATAKNMKLVMAGLYENEIRKDRLKLSMRNLGSAEINKDEIKLIFHICKTSIDNALQHTHLKKIVVSVTGMKRAGFGGLLFSSACAKGSPDEFQFEGLPGLSRSRAVFTEGKSGLYKIAAMAAAIAQKQVTVTVKRTRLGFHVFVPLEAL